MGAYPKIHKIIVFVMIVLLLVCTFSAFIPHGHNCGAADCAICAMLKTAQELLPALFLIFGAELVLLIYTILSGKTERSSVFENTLVALKVKLSD